MVVDDADDVSFDDYKFQVSKRIEKGDYLMAYTAVE